MNTFVSPYFATFGFQAAIGGAVALAMAVLWMAHPRRATAFWAAVWILLPSGQVAGLLAFRAHSAHPYGAQAAVAWSASLAFFFGALYLVTRGTKSLVVDVAPARLRLLHLLAFSTAGAALAIWRVRAEAPMGGNFIESSGAYLRVASVVVSSWAAWTLARGRGWRENVGTRVLSAALALVAGRAVLSLALQFHWLPTPVADVLADSLLPMQVMVQVFYGAGTLVAVLADERREAMADETRLQEMERSLLHGQRLEELGRMAGGVAHDFNNLLNVIQASAELAQAETTADAPVAVELTSIQLAAERGVSLTRQLLEFARGGRATAVAFDPRERVEALVPILRRMLPRRVRMMTEFAGPPVQVEAAASQFDQVVLNLVANARDASSAEGEVHLLIDVLPPEGNTAARFRLRVRDNGTGIPADVLPRVFEPFFSTKSALTGTGLGLATCRSAVERAGGTIEIYSEIGKGTMVEVRLPVVSAA